MLFSRESQLYEVPWTHLSWLSLSSCQPRLASAVSRSLQAGSCTLHSTAAGHCAQEDSLQLSVGQEVEKGIKQEAEPPTGCDYTYFMLHIWSTS